MLQSIATQLRRRSFFLCLVITLINAKRHIVLISSFVPTLKSSFGITPRRRNLTKFYTMKITSKDPLPEQDPNSSLPFSKKLRTTKISPTTHLGPFGSGGTVVGFSKYPGVRNAFEENFSLRLELGAQLVIYEQGEKVVDLTGAAPETVVEGNGQNYDGDTLQVVCSSGKNMEAIAIAMIVDRGLLSYEDPVSKHWPEFGAHGKNQITVADVMRHSGGVPFVVDPDSKATIAITTRDIFEVDPMEKKICNALKYPPNDDDSSLCYHALTRGLIVNGILRRVDPSGRSLGHFLREEVTDPLSKSNENDEPVKFFCGIPREEQLKHTFAPFTDGSILYTFFALILPSLFGFNPQLAAYLRWFIRKDGFRGLFKSVAFPFPTILFPSYTNTPEARSIELPSGLMFTNARSMAYINAAAMAGDGSLRGVRLLSQKGVERSMGDVVTATDSATGATLGFTRGGYCQFSESFKKGNIETNTLFHPDDKSAYGNFVGWGGVGGSLSLVDRERNIAFAYCTNGIGLDALWGIRSRRILLELQKALAE